MVVVNFNTLRICSVHHIFKRVQKLNKVKNYCLMCGGMTRNRCGGAFSERALTPTLIFFTRAHTPTHPHTYSPASTFSSALLVYQVLSPDPPAKSLLLPHSLDSVSASSPAALGAGWTGTTPALAGPGSAPLCSHVALTTGSKVPGVE